MRPLEDGSNAVIVKALQQLYQFSHNYGWVSKPDLASGIRYVLDKVEDGNAFVGHGYLLLVSEFEPWYGKERILQEDLVLRLPDQPSYNLGSIPYFITALAKARECDLVLVGNSYTTNGMSKLYQSRRHGFTKCSEIFYKEL